MATYLNQLKMSVRSSKSSSGMLMDGRSRIQSDAGERKPGSGEDFIVRVYDELRDLASRYLANEGPGQNFEAAALVNEAWIRLAKEQDLKFKDPHHFYCVAATAMRRVLVDDARRKKALRHGGDLQRTILRDIALSERMLSDDLIALDEALAELVEVSADAARLVELRFFAGFRHQEAARVMGLTRGEADRLWAFARSWLFDAVNRNLSGMHAPLSS